MKFLVAYQKDDKNLVKIELDNGEQVWAQTSEAVYNFAKKVFKGDEVVNIQYNEKNGQYFVTRIEKIAGAPTTSKEVSTTGYSCADCGVELKDGKYKKCYNCNKGTSTETASPEYSCEDCGCELKNDKYQKCYNCNKKTPASDKPSGKYYGKSPEESEKIKRLSILSSVCHAVEALTGQVDLNSIGDVIETLYDRFHEKVSK